MLGVSPWATAYDIWLDKLGMSPEFDNAKMEWGRRLEDVVAQAWCEKHRAQVESWQGLFVHEVPYIRATPDRVVLPDGSVGLEIKTTGAHHAERWGTWDESMPEEVWVQVQHCLLVTGYAGWWVAVLIGGSEYRDYFVRPDLELHAMMREEYRDFWRTVTARTPPEGASPSKRSFVAQRFRDDSGRYVQATPELDQQINELKRLSEERAAIEKRMDAIDARLRSVVGGDRGIQGTRHTVRYEPQKDGVDWYKVAMALGAVRRPEVIADHTKPRERRRYWG